METTETTTTQPANPRRWPWIVAVLAALFVGVGIGAAAADTEPAAEVDNTAAEEALEQRAAELDAREDELNEWEADLADWTDVLSELTALLGTDDPMEFLALLDAATAPVITEPESEVSGDYTAGQYEISDVQVRKDYADDFEVRARVTNTGSSKEFVVFTATIFKDGSIVGTADSFVDSFDADSTITVTFTTSDDYTDWDDVEFQVDTEW